MLHTTDRFGSYRLTDTIIDPRLREDDNLLTTVY